MNNGTAASALELLQAATDLLREEILTHIPTAQRHSALMLNHALGIVGRELTMTWPFLVVERGVLARFVRMPENWAENLELDGTVIGLRSRLVSGLRSGEFDAREHELLSALTSLVRLRCSIDAPKALQ